ncbi:hypothetical protein C8J56DRAFT_927628 [Mycena floridula]|nr:hypothetical protein C8J56DRAFT_927628 [Mycena floridula]
MAENNERTALLPFLSVTRVRYIDNLRTLLVGLLIFHDASLAYGGLGVWPYSSPYYLALSSRPIVIFNAINQAFIGGLFFFISGYCSALSAETKSNRQFAKDKLVRLGVPALVETIVLDLFGVLFAVYNHDLGKLRDLYYWRTLRGPVWYLIFLLCLDLIYIFIRSTGSRTGFSIGSYKSFVTAAFLSLTFIIVCSLSSRIGTFSWIFNPFDSGFSTFPFQYVLAYIVGHGYISLQQYLLPSFPAILLAVSYGTAAAAFWAAMLIFGSSSTIIVGRVTTAAIFFAIFNEMCFYFISTSLLGVFQGSALTRKKWGMIPRYSYAAVLVHPIVVVILQSVFHRWVISGTVIALLVGSASVIFSWALGWALVQIPGVNRFV